MVTPARFADALPEGDEALMLAYAAGDAAAFDILYGRHKGGVYRYLLRHCGNPASADELFQDVWLSVIRVRASYATTSGAKFATWLYRIARNRIVDHWRSSGQVHLVSGPDADGDDMVDQLAAPEHAGPEQCAHAGELRERLQAALAALPPLQRDAFLLHQEAGLELADIAALAGVGIETVKSRLRYASGRLRTLLGDLR
ncbi:MAG: RNA polymerase sigma factor [Casimicrobiaceae bacterium]